MRRRCLETAVLCLLLTGCSGDRTTQALPQARLAALRACAQPVAATAVAGLRASLHRVERCMARRNLPGHARFDRTANAIHYAYDPPTLRF